MSDSENLDQDYSKAGFGGRLGFGARPALVLVDFIMAYFEPDAPLYAGVEEEARVAAELLEAARAAGIPVFFTKVEYETGDNEAALFLRKVKPLNDLVAGGPLSEIHPSLAPRDGEPVLVKKFASAFFGTPLAEMLRENGCDSLFVTGLTTSGCVRATALDTLQNGFIPVVIEDACGDRDPAVQAANLFDLGAKYADIVKSEEAIKFLSQLGH